MNPNDNPTRSRRDRLLKPETHDPYRRDRKLHDPTVCPDCTAVFRDGRWTWAAGPADAPRVRCPACARTADGYAAGFVSVRGLFAPEQRRELENLLRNVEAEQKRAHPLKRILDTADSEGGIEIRTTDGHLARDLGAALKRAFGGDLEVDYAEDLVRVAWTR